MITRIYSYGCLAPIQGIEVIDDQLRRAHRYRNTLVEIERWRRERIAAVKIDPQQIAAGVHLHGDTWHEGH